MYARSVTNNIDFNKSEQYTLSIRLNADGFSFSICNPVGGDVFFERKEVDPAISLTANIKRIFKETDYLHLPYKEVNVLLINKRFVLLPLELFDEEQVETIFYYNHNLRENEEVCYNILKKNNVVVIFGIDKSTHNFLKDKFKSIHFYFHFSPLIEYFTRDSRTASEKKMYAYMRKKTVDIYCFERGTLLLANTFDCRDENDRQYYILYMWKQLGFDQQTDILRLIGTPSYNNNKDTTLQRFIKDISVVEHSSGLPYDMDIMLSLNT